LATPFSQRLDAPKLTRRVFLRTSMAAASVSPASDGIAPRRRSREAATSQDRPFAGESRGVDADAARGPGPRGAARGAGRRDARGEAPTVGRSRHNARVRFTRIAWLITVLACLLTCLALLLSGYQGYAAVLLAVGLCAAVNLLL
jgi:hypothetical protein